MDKRLIRLIKEYVDAINAAVLQLRASGIPIPNSDVEWATNGIQQSGVLDGGGRYYKHGYGCAVHSTDCVVDFDFGAEGQTNGFDCWRLAGFAGDRLGKFGFMTVDELKTVFDEATASGELRSSGYMLYYLNP